MKRRVLGFLLAGIMAVSVTGCGSSGKSGEWAKNVEIQVPAKAGGGTDVMARALSTQIAQDSGKNLAVVNNTDGGGVVAMEKTRAGKADGSTLLQFHTTMLIKTATGVYDKSAAEDFSVIAVGTPVDKGTYLLVVSGSSPYKTLDDLLAAAKAAPGTMLLGVETGGLSHVLSGMFAQKTGTDMKYVEAGSDTEKLTALVGGSIDCCFVNPNQAKQYIESGKAIGLACVSADSDGGRSGVMPDIPSFTEQGIDFSFSTINLILGPKNMDPKLVQSIHDYYEAAAKNESVNEILEPAGFAMEILSLEDGTAMVQKMQTEINAVVDDLGIKQQ